MTCSKQKKLVQFTSPNGSPVFLDVSRVISVVGPHTFKSESLILVESEDEEPLVTVWLEAGWKPSAVAVMESLSDVLNRLGWEVDDKHPLLPPKEARRVSPVSFKLDS